MPTGPKTCRLASFTKALPGPMILSTAGTVSVPKARAAMACAPPMRKMRSAPERWQPATMAWCALGGRQAITSSTPATLAGTMVMIGADKSGKRPPGT